MRVAIVHDYLTQRGGAERVVLAMLKAFPTASVYTSVYDPSRTFPEFANYHVQPSFLNHVPMVKAEPRRAAPLLPMIFGRISPGDVDVVIASSSGWAHGVKTSVPVLVYCHNPARWLYQIDDYRGELSRKQQQLLRLSAARLKAWDQRSARRAHTYLANSTSVAERASLQYDRSVGVLHPPRGLTPLGPREALPGLSPGFLLTVGRRRGYKNTNAIMGAMELLTSERLVVIGSSVRSHNSGRVSEVGYVSDAQLRWLYANAKLLIAASFEDFGLTPVEAAAFGLPVVALNAGGYRDTVVHGLTGILIDGTSSRSIATGVRMAIARPWDAEQIRKHGERFSPEVFCAGLELAVRNVMRATGRSD